MEFAPAGPPSLVEQRRPWYGTAALVAVVLLAALGSAYSAALLLNRITPALFPGKELPLPPLIQPVVENLPGPLKIVAPAEASFFNRPLHFLMIGLDRRPGNDNFATLNSDSIAVARLDPSANTARMLSLPRDLYIEIHPRAGGVYQDRINTSFAVGAGQSQDYGSGAEQVMRDLEANFKVKVDYWVVLEMDGVERLIDAVGGIDVVIPEDLAVGDWYYSDDDKIGVWVKFPAGPMHLDGYHAVAFSRSREQDDDFHRMRRQQLVLDAAVRKALENGLIANPFPLMESLGRGVHTNIPLGRIPGFALAFKATGGRVSMYSLSDPVNGRPTISEYRTPRGASVLRWDARNASFWFKDVLDAPVRDLPEIASVR